MKHEPLAAAVTGIDDALLEDALQAPSAARVPRRKVWYAAAGLLLVFCAALLWQMAAFPRIMLEGAAVGRQPVAVVRPPESRELGPAVQTAQAAQELRVQLSVSCPRRVELTVSAGELQVLSGESPVYRGNAYSGSGSALSVLWVIAGARPDAVYRMTVNEKVLALSCDEQGTWTIRQQ